MEKQKGVSSSLMEDREDQRAGGDRVGSEQRRGRRHHQLRNPEQQLHSVPAAIQGRGANVYVIGVTVPNPYLYVDLATYTCQEPFGLHGGRMVHQNNL